MPYRLLQLAGLGLALAVLGACEGVREQLGLSKQSPDEFTVVRKAPLVLPPEFTLRPPAPGAERPQERSPSVSARNVLTENSRSASESSLDGDVDSDAAAEQALLRLAGASDPDPGIRTQVNRESQDLAERDQSFVDALIFWQEPVAPGTVVDANRERQRLQENAAIGEPVTSGETPSIVRRKKGLFEGIF